MKRSDFPSQGRRRWHGLLQGTAVLSAAGLLAFGTWRAAADDAATKPNQADPQAKAPAKQVEEVKEVRPAQVSPSSGRIDLEIQQELPLPAEQAAAEMTLPEGFKATLAAAEPEIRQPIAMAIDDRGRLWVAECYSYPVWSSKGRDRILIFEDTDGDGRLDKRKVFWDQGNYLSGLEVGFGGVWVCCAPNLLFIPDADGDDVPDGEPQVVLDGWSNQGVHNVVNGLAWGPDGWLYGLNGITAPSKVGKPGTPEDKRVALNCSVWRYHPTRETFEVVAHGTTNPWGLDWDDYGQAFITNCVISHLFHVVPGAHFQRMFGDDLNPYAYGLMPACCDHLHWGGGKWTDSRGGQGAHSIAGGGHAHSGAMIYLGDNWPESYRNSILMGNIHGKRLNRDLLARSGSGYIARHAPDFMLSNDQWFRGLDFQVGPDGGMWLIDWSDTGECHERDAHGAHHDSGRIFKVTYGTPQPATGLPLSKANDAELVRRQLHQNDWHVRTSRRLLQERAAAGADMTEVARQLRAMFHEQPDVRRKLRALWTLYAIGQADRDFLAEQLNHESDQVRLWAVRLLVDRAPLADALPKLADLPADEVLPSAAVLKRFAELAANDPSAQVRLELASALQRLPLEQRWPIAEALVAHEQDADDPNLPLMIWYGVEPLVPANKARALKLVAACKIPLVRQHIARRAVAQ
jgi:putative membrane-bound dehydrogenase-like protein